MKASKLYRQSDDFCSGEWPAAAPKKRPKATGIQENFSKKISVAERHGHGLDPGHLRRRHRIHHDAQ